jgi:L-threonylcarbamoyladenylate synthase
MNPNLLAPTDENLLKSAQNLLLGNLVAFPTETVYGLGASATNEVAVNRIYEVKRRPMGHPLIVHISNISKMDIWAKEIPDFAWDLAKAFWPGPMTLILKRSDIAKDFITGGQETVGLRIPNNNLALELLNKFENLGGIGVAAPSANRFGAVSPTAALHVLDELKSQLNDSDIVLDGGESEIGIESTIIEYTGNKIKILRPGGITIEEIQNLNSDIEVSEGKSCIKHSGQFESHYSPKAKVLLDVEPQRGDGLIAMRNLTTPEGCVRLADPVNELEFAKHLYSSLRKGDNLKLKRIVIFQPENTGLGTAIRNRLQKAAAE